MTKETKNTRKKTGVTVSSVVIHIGCPASFSRLTSSLVVSLRCTIPSTFSLLGKKKIVWRKFSPPKRLWGDQSKETIPGPAAPASFPTSITCFCLFRLLCLCSAFSLFCLFNSPSWLLCFFRSASCLRHFISFYLLLSLLLLGFLLPWFSCAPCFLSFSCAPCFLLLYLK